MIDMTKIDKYIDETYPDVPAIRRNSMKNSILRMLNTYDDVPLEEWTRKNFVDALSQRKVRFTSFDAYKSNFKDYLKWLYEQGYDVIKQIKHLESIGPNEIITDEYINKTYYQDIDDLFNQIHDLLYEREEEFQPFICGAILVWYGFDIRAIEAILKTDVTNDSNSIIDYMTGKKIEIADNYMIMIRDYRDTEVYKTAKMGGKMIHYKPSKYLFRNCYTVQMSDRTFNNMLLPINRLAKELDMSFNWKSIAMSGNFYRLYKYEKEHSKVARNSYEELAKFFYKTDVKLTQGIKQVLVKNYDEYVRFKNVFYGN